MKKGKELADLKADVCAALDELAQYRSKKPSPVAYEALRTENKNLRALAKKHGNDLAEDLLVAARRGVEKHIDSGGGTYQMPFPKKGRLSDDHIQLCA